MLDSIKNNGFSLALFACICTLIVASVNALTKDAIKVQEQKALLRSLNQVIPTSEYNNELAQNCITLSHQPLLGNMDTHRIYRAFKGSSPSAAIIETTAPDGYSGDINLLVSITYAGEVTGVRAVTHQETPGLGDKIDRSKSNWVESFVGKYLSEANTPTWAVKKDGGSFDQFTGATITPRAVVNAVKNTLEFFNNNKAVIFQQPNTCEANDAAN